jgi:phosphatidylethanolamine/phosphatidyl-N-methylethanolamine N-methyltransferase
MSWPKERAPLTDEQSAIMEDWIREFLTSVKSTRFGWVSRFDHTFPVRSASSELRTLEIGAGTGTHLQYEPNGEYVALEASGQLAAQIPQRDGLSVVVADCEQRLPWDDNSFDRVLAIHVLEHLYNLPAALEEVARVLRPGGVFCVVIPCEGGALYSLGRRFTTKRIFEKRYNTPYEWMISQDHCNTAREVLAELHRHFRVRRRRFFPLRMPTPDLNLVIGLELLLGPSDA